MKPEPMTADECLMWLAERTRDVRVIGPVPLFPTLRGECPCPNEQRHDDRACCASCPCQGRGWVVAGVHLEDVLAIALHLRGVASVMFTLTDDGLTACYIWGKTSPHEPMGHAKAKTNVGAVIRAIVAAIQAQEENGQGGIE